MRCLPCLLVTTLFAVLVGGSAQPTRAATGSTVVGAEIATATTIDPSGCAPGQLGRTGFGTVLPGSAQVTTLDCVVRFGSSNGRTALQLSQFDGAGPAMYAPTAGQRDNTFSGDGVLVEPIGAGTAADFMNSSLSTSDGRLVMIGTCDMGATGLDACLIRMNVDGTLDTTFDGDGIRTLPIGPGANLDYGIDVVESTGGKLLVASQCYAGTTGLDHCLVQLLPDGSLDPAFGAAGIVVRNFASTHDYVRGLHRLPNGSFLVGGDCDNGTAGRSQCVARYLADGTLDTSFGSGGLASHRPGGTTPSNDSQLLVTADGSIVMGSACYVDAATNFDFCLSRFRADGTLDTSFGSSGSTMTAASSGRDSVTSLAELGDGRLIVGGHCDEAGLTGWDACLVRYAANGTQDSTFGTGGVSRIRPSPGSGDDLLRTVLHDGTGKFLVVGRCNSAATGDDFCVYRVDGEGALDTTFGTNGVTMHPVVPGLADDMTRQALALGDGQVLIVGGCTTSTTGQDACAILLDSAGSMAQYQPGTADWSTPNTGHFAACLLSSGTSSATWPTSTGCPATDGSFWNAVPARAAGVATAPAGIADASAVFRFGLRVPPSQAPGAYVAPIAFSVVAA